MKKIKSKIYNNYPNLYIWLKKHIQKETNFPINIHNFLSKNLNENPLIIEAGAADGRDTLFFAKKYSKSQIYALEPVEKLFNELIIKTEKYSNVNLQKIAFDTSTGKSNIFTTDLNSVYYGASSLMMPEKVLELYPDITFDEKEEVETITFDDFLNQNKIEKIDLLWFDLQGKEPEILMQSNSLDLINYIYTEVSLIENYKDQILYPELKDFLISKNFKIVFEDIRWEDGGNVLFKNKKL